MGGDLPARGNFAALTPADIEHFRSALENGGGGGGAVLTDDKSLDDANVDWMRKYKGASQVHLASPLTDNAHRCVTLNPHLETSNLEPKTLDPTS